MIRKTSTGDPQVLWLLVVLGATLLARAVYWLVFEVRFDDGLLIEAIQYIDPALLQSRLLESLLYLHEQPPLFNLFLGLVLKTSSEPRAVFAVAFLLCGFVLALGLYCLLARLEVPPWLAAIVTLAFSIHPTAILYENYLFYTYPLACSMCLAALFLHRYVSEGTVRDGLVFSTVLAMIVLTRGLFHHVWLLAILGGLFALLRGRRKQVAWISLVPLLLVSALYLKNYVLFGQAVAGKFIVSLNLLTMTVDRLPEEERDRLVRLGELSPVGFLNNRVWSLTVDDYERVLGPFETKGVPLLDQRYRSTGAVNFHNHAWDVIGELGYADAKRALRRYPRVYLEAVRENALRYFEPAADYFNFTTIYPNRARLEPLFRGLGFLHTTAFDVVILGTSVLFSAWFVGRWLLRRWRPARAGTGDDALGCTLLFCLFNVLYVAIVTVLVSYGDHNRYRAEVAPLFYVMFGVLSAFALRRRSGSDALERSA